jgi:hypothetical protein
MDCLYPRGVLLDLLLGHERSSEAISLVPLRIILALDAFCNGKGQRSRFNQISIRNCTNSPLSGGKFSLLCL